MNRNHIICLGSKRYSNKGNKGADYQMAQTEANDLMGSGDFTKRSTLQINL